MEDNMKESIHERQEKQVYNCLKELGISPDLRGYHYITYIVQDMLKRNPMYATKSMMQKYDATSVYFNTTIQKVERCIRNSVEKCFDNTPPNVLEKYFGNSISMGKGKLTNKQFIASVCEYIKVVERRPNR